MTPDLKPNDDETGLPVLRTWPAVYIFVLVTFAVWAALLWLLTRTFS